MAGDIPLRPMSPTARSWEFGNAALAWTRCRRGRVFLMSAVFVLVGFVMLGPGGIKHETLSDSYRALPQSWRPHLPYFSSPTSPLKPSNTTLEIENGIVAHIPPHLNKATPNFHLLMPALRDSPEFCKTTLSAMILNYPPPTIVGMKEKYVNKMEKERGKLMSVLGFLGNRKVRDEDLMLVVDGRDTWFQLPSHVLVRQYEEVLRVEEKRLRGLYGGRFNHTIVFGAIKICKGGGECGEVPESTLPKTIYGKETGKEVEVSPAKYLDAGVFMGPVGDLKRLYERAVQAFEEKKRADMTVQEVMATIFAQQQAGRERRQKEPGKFTATESLFDWLDTSSLPSMSGRKKEQETESLHTDDTSFTEFSMTLDYTHTLFQPLSNNAPEEIVQLRHDDPEQLTRNHHKDTPTPPFTIPTALEDATPPFWTQDFRNHKKKPSPHTKSVYIAALQYQKDIDKLQDRNTPWTSVPLVQNTYTGSVPAIFFHTSPYTQSTASKTPNKHTPVTPSNANANITWSSFWYNGSERALLRNYFRIAQSPIGYHNMAVGGDRVWDQRGGKGGVWTAARGEWLPWGEVDGVCGSLERLQQTFSDAKGVWLHEKEGVAKSEKGRKEEEKKLADGIEQMKKKAKEKVAKEKAVEKEEKAKEEKAKEEKAKEEKAKEEKAKEEKAKEKLVAEETARKKGEAEKAAKEKAAKEKGEKEKATKEKGEKEKGEKQNGEKQKDETDKKKAGMEKAAKEKVERVKTAKEKAARVKTEKVKAEKEKAAKAKAKAEKEKEKEKEKAQNETENEARRLEEGRKMEEVGMDMPEEKEEAKEGGKEEDAATPPENPDDPPTVEQTNTEDPVETETKDTIEAQDQDDDGGDVIDTT